MRAAARLAACAAVAFAALAAGPAVSARYEGNVNLFVGQKWMKEGEWAPVDQQTEIGVMFAFAPERSPIYFAIDATASRDSQTVSTPLYGPVDVAGKTEEYSIGIRKVWNGNGRATRPFIAAGGCLAKASIDFDGNGLQEHAGDSAYGVWLEAGITWRIGGHFNLGFDLRYSTASASLDELGAPIDVEAGGFHAGALIGYGW
jgi:hypothetical protein